jgi:CRP/FNR family transcriptional regulator, cyclic AMP receptor protein
MSDRIELLRSIALFEALGGEDVAGLAQTLDVLRYRPGDVIFRQGDPGAAMYIVERGTVKIHLAGERGEKILLKELSRGEYFGELALFDDQPRSATAQASDDVELLELTRDDLTGYIDRRPRAAMAILRTMTERLRATDALLTQRAARNVDEEIEKNLGWSDLLADKVARWNGSWAFIVFLMMFSGGWALLNTTMVRPPDAYPYQFFNLLLAVLVALQGPLIVMSQNREGMKDRARAETDYKVNLKNEVNIETLLRELAALRQELAERPPREAAGAGDGRSARPGGG